MRHTISFTFAVLLAGVLSVQVNGATTYHFTDLGDLPGGTATSHAYGINSIGQVVGNSSAAFFETVGISHAFLWTGTAGGMQDLGTGPGSLSGAVSINDSGQIAGNYEINGPDGVETGRHAVIWTSSGGPQEIGELAGDNASIGRGNNNNGQVVGDSSPFSNNYISHAFIWSSSEGMQYLGHFPGGADNSITAGVNDNGEVAGTSDSGNGSRAFRWTKAGGMQNLGGIPGGSGPSSATGISNSGDIIGIGNISNTTHAFLWRSGTGMQDLGSIPSISDRSTPYDINSNDVVVGYLTGQFSSQDRAFIWTVAGGMKDLNSMLDSSGSGWTLNIAQGINDAGQIVGLARNSSGIFHAFLLTPAPEPSTFFLAVGACAALSTHRRRCG